MLVFSPAEDARVCGPDLPTEAVLLEARWDIAIADCEDMETFTTVAENADLMTVEKLRPDFAGKIRYTAHLDGAEDIKRIELKGVGDTALLAVNGKTVARRICAPFTFRTDGLWREGTNTVEITVSTTLGRKWPERFSACMVSNPPGLEGPVIAHRTKR